MTKRCELQVKGRLRATIYDQRASARDPYPSAASADSTPESGRRRELKFGQCLKSISKDTLEQFAQLMQSSLP
jgi:hypothetical protein